MVPLVAPFTGAWIEMAIVSSDSAIANVAPFTGAWIEIHRSSWSLAGCLSLPSRERGLKCIGHAQKEPERLSLPSRERGLKFYGDKGLGLAYPVAPFTGAWIEISRMGRTSRGRRSLPSRERGLKFILDRIDGRIISSLPSRERGLKFAVGIAIICTLTSLPSRERGLKSHPAPAASARPCRSLHGSVD